MAQENKLYPAVYMYYQVIDCVFRRTLVPERLVMRTIFEGEGAGNADLMRKMMDPFIRPAKKKKNESDNNNGHSEHTGDRPE